MNTDRIWHYIDLKITPENSDACLNLCWESGALGVIEDTPDTGWCRVFFPDMTMLHNAIYNLDSANMACTIRQGIVQDPGWQTAWHRYFTPQPVGTRFMILPSWESVMHNDRIHLRIHPGQAFGTGYHETTALCLRIIETISLNGKSVLDAGCGSGVLGIAAAKLGASSVVGLDIEPEAVAEAAVNAGLNMVSDVCRWKFDSVENVSGKYDCILGNLHTTFLRDNIKELLQHLEINGSMVLSGFLVTEAEKIIEICTDFQSARLKAHLQQGEWSAILVDRTV